MVDGDNIPKVKEYEGFGELTIGGGRVETVLLVALCMLNDPKVNQYLLDNKLKLSDRLTKTKIFPREGMSLPGNTTYAEKRRIDS